METVWQFKTARFKVELILTHCDDLDLSWCETGETARNLESGLWQAFDSQVRVTLDGVEIGSAALGESIYEKPRDFWEEHRDPDPMNRNCTIMREAQGNVSICHYFPGMVSEAIREARDYLANVQTINMRIPA